MFTLEAPALSSNVSVSYRQIGRELSPLLVIDDCLADPDSLVEFAKFSEPGTGKGAENLHPVFQQDKASFYPGLRCPLPDEFGRGLLQQLTPLLHEYFSQKGDVAFKPLITCLSLACVKKEQLRPIQSLPHFDDVRNDQLAMVLYLFKGDLGGTGFYRHVSTGFERITRTRLPEYAPVLKAEAVGAGKGLFGRYMGRDNVFFDATDYVEPMFNRAIIYPSNCLHSGVLNNAVNYSSRVNKGRLTANMLIICNEV
ncbi:DUF6445 family protein [Simiduia litorea]